MSDQWLTDRQKRMAERNDRIVDLYKSGKDKEEISQTVDLSESRVYAILVKAGVVRPEPNAGKYKQIEFDVQQAVRQYHSGMAVRDIAAAHGVSRETMRTRLTEQGLNLALRKPQKVELDEVKAVRQYSRGLSTRKVADLHDVGYWTMRNLLKDRGVLRPPGGNRQPDGGPSVVDGDGDGG